MLTTRTWILLITAVLLAIAGGLNFEQRLEHKPPPTDGIDWTQSSEGIIARSVAPDSAAGRAGVLGVMPGDRLAGVSLNGNRFEEITEARDVQIYLEQAGVGGSIRYLIERPSFPEESRFYYASLNNLGSLPGITRRDLYLNFIGLVYLLVGLFVLLKQGGRAPFVLHFAALCLVAFIFHFYSPVGWFRDLDLAVTFLDDSAIALFAPLFLHFCLIYPAKRRLFERRRIWTATLYLPALVLIALNALIDFVPRFRFSDAFIGGLYKVEFGQFLLALAAGSACLMVRFLRSQSALVRQQLKWIVWGSTFAVTIFGLLYGAGYLFELNPPAELLSAALQRRLADIAVLPLVLIPLTFAHSVMRYRLMDVDVVVRRAAVYALTTLSIALMIGSVVYAAGVYALGAGAFTSGAITMRVIIAIVAMAVIVMMGGSIKNFLQERTDRIFYGERYDLRNGLLDFGRTLSASTALEPLMNALARRLEQVLGVERLVIFIEDEEAPGHYRVARASGIENASVPPDFREMIRSRAAEDGVVRADDIEPDYEVSGYVRHALHYYVPCVARGRMIAVIGLGRSTGGALLSSEDLEIVRTVSGYIAVAIENSLLYQEQRERAAELEALKEFNESIIESVNVGLLAISDEGRVTSCNSALETILRVNRDEILGVRFESLFDGDFSETLKGVLGEEGWRLTAIRHIYKLRTDTRANRELILNLTLAPMKSSGAVDKAGALVMIEDVTSRVRLEEQLQQREKLSSIGLLAAGVAHEINTPLTGISSYTQMLMGTMPEADPKHALLQKIRRQAERAAGIINNLLNFSRTGTATEFKTLNINRVLDDTLQLLEPQLRHGHIQIVRIYDSEPPEVHGNSGKLQQVFTNLVLNARDAILDEGKITISTTNDMEEGLVIVEISDTGIGIAPENVARIYDPFFSTKGVGRGTGLGLAVTYGIVQEHSGRITVRSAPGHGTTFRLVLSSIHASHRLQAAGD